MNQCSIFFYRLHSDSMFKHKNTSLYLFPSDSAETDLSWDARAGKSAMEAASEWKRLSEDRENKKGVIISLS